MHRIQFIHQPRDDSARSLRAVLASCAFHGLALGLLLGLTFLYRSHLPPAKSGSPPGAPSISLETMVIVSSPPEPAPLPSPTPPSITPPSITPAAITVPLPQIHEPVVLPKLPEEGVPVLAVQSSKPAPPLIRPAIHPVISPMASPTAQSHPKPATTASSSSYAPGLNLLPHPPYPTEARNLGETGTVIMNVHFDARGNVAHVEVAQPSGVPLLDTATRSFICAHWHSATYAGQTISQPVQYSLENP